MKEYYHFRPSARLMRTIGDKIIKDLYAAIVELVKNAYDADANKVEVKFLSMKEPQKAKIIIKDDGHGMDYETVVKKWMVPATTDKSDRRKSPNGRNMQGRKGIGRFAAAVLGDNILMKTTDKRGNTIKVQTDWKIFDSEQYLDEIKIPVEVDHTGDPSGTELIIKPEERATEWTKIMYEILITELRKLVSPIKKKENFDIWLELKNIGIEEYNNWKQQIEPFPLLELYDYRLRGDIDEKGNANLTFRNQVEKNILPEKIKLEIPLDKKKNCGPISFDFRVFDRDPEAITDLINRGLKDPTTGKFIKKTEARQLLNKICGVGVYRDGFRVRPYGDPGYDWLELDKARVQNPSMRIGADQIAGFVNISNEETSHLEEKSARDGLKENDYYFLLVEIIKKCLAQLEEKRFDYRKKTGRGRKSVKIKKELATLFDFTGLKKSLGEELRKSNVPESVLTKVENVILKTEKSKAKTLTDIEETIAMYEGQVTVGKIIIVIMHEGRKPLKYLKEQCPHIAKWVKDLQKSYDTALFDKIIDRLEDTEKESLILIELFNRLDPLAVKKRGNKKPVNVNKVMRRIGELFKNEFARQNIKFINEINEELDYFGWEQDLYTAMTNLVDNSLYWLSQVENKEEKQIRISAQIEDNNIVIDFCDNGPGIKRKYIESNIIFEPGFSTKPEGTGLGLSIAGEAIERNNGKLKAIYDSEGAYFRIELPKGEEG